MTDFRALCADLLEAYEIELGELRFDNRLAKRARAALAEPEPEGPTDNELEEEFGRALLKLPGDSMNATAVSFARAVLTRWGKPS